ncbi:zinc finger and BTB domain-containing protein 24-like [Anneissia japonica]|uniref:zinc finger and BTB domain-containing protein 24-like n=1 Tax=Anneissia japonica TaxID=1529436 RepID=UPI00142570CD|nr:zinc finger and BTB domain-containing protein 24-like [Anneissia japonica]
METELNDNSSPKKRRRGRPRKCDKVTSCLTSSQNNYTTQENSDVNKVLDIDAEGTKCMDETVRQTRRSGRQVKVPTRYNNYVVERDNTPEDITKNISEVYECDACFKTFLSKCSIYCHQYTCVAEKELSCDICQETLHSYKDLRTHRKTHRYYSCDFCKQEFKNIAEYRVHSRWHSLQTIECNICHRRFLRMKALKEHMVQEHDRPMEMYTCPMCQKTFALLDYLKEHQKTHEGEDGYTMEYIVKPLVKDTTKRNTCAQDKPGKTQQFVKKTLEPQEIRNKERDNEAVPLNLNKPMASSEKNVKRVRRPMKASSHVVVHVHVQPDEEEGQKIVTTCQEEQVTAENTQQLKQQQETTAEAIFSLMGGQLPEGCMVVLAESEEPVNEFEREATTAAIELIQQEQQNGNIASSQDLADGGNKETPALIESTYSSAIEEVQTGVESQLEAQGDEQTQQLVVNEEVVDQEQNQQIHQSGQTDQISRTEQTMSQNAHEILEGNQIILPDGQTIVVEQENNLVPGQKIYLQHIETFSDQEHGQVSSQQIIMQGQLVEQGHSVILNNQENVIDGQHTVLVQEGPDGHQHTMFVQEGPGGHHQHVLLQTAEDCVAIGSNEHHVIVQEDGDIVSSNQHVIMQSGDGTTLLLEGDCSVGDSIIVAAMQHV